MPGTRDRRSRRRSAPRRSLRFSFVLPFVVPALCLTGLWGHTAAGLLDERVQLQTDADRDSAVARPAQAVLTALQNERRATAVWQAKHSRAARAALDAARRETDAALTASSGSAASGGSALRRRATSLDEALAALTEHRDAIDGRTLSAADTFQYFTDTIGRGVLLVTAAVRSDDGSLAHGGSATVSLMQITEMLSRQDALLSGALPSGGMSLADRTRFGQYLALRREFGTTLTVGDLPAGTAAAYAQLTDGRRWTTLRAVGDSVTGAGTGLPGTASAWPDAADAVLPDLQALGSDSLRGLAGEASDRADDLLLGILVGTAATLAALTGGAVLALRARRATLGRVSELQSRTEDLTRTLPQLLARIERGERVDAGPPAPQGRHSTDELERLARAIDRLGRVATDTAMHQSLGREGTEKVFAQLIRRTQILVHRLISLLDDLERKHEDSDLLKDIFKVDHLATRVRRHAENLMILSGSLPGRRLTAPVSLTDVMRGAVAETEQYTRVKVKNLPADRRLAVAGRAVADVTHLLAELIENGTSFSPPDTQVSVSATKVAKGLAVHVEDQGLGMPAEKIAQANELLAHPPRVDMTALGEDPRLGHFVVARLADRHGIKVELRESVYGGTLVVVVLPSALLEEHRSPVLDQLTSAAAAAGHTLEAAAGQALPGTGNQAVAGGAGGAAAPVAAAAEPLVHSRVPDHSGFPEYGGAGLLPPVSEHPVPPPPDPAPRTGPPPGREPGRGQGTPAGQAPAPEAGRPPTTPRVLPQRTRGASLAQQLRREAAQAQGRREGERDQGVISPDASARAMIAIQQGLERARTSRTDGTDGADGADARPADPRDPGANQL
ncbi:sensor histidine kinase [Streptomyces nodosus]